MRAVIAAIETGALDANAVLAVSNRRQAPALDFARAHGLQTRLIPTLADPGAADASLAEALTAANIDLVILSGYLRRLGPLTLKAFANRVLNIHPALLPNFGGEGMYGLRVHEAVIASGQTVSGASVHVVDAEYDHGPVLAQVEVPVLTDDTPQSLQARVMAAEPGLFVETLRRIAARELTLPA